MLSQEQQNMVNAIIYGARVKYVNKKREIFLYLNESDQEILVILPCREGIPDRWRTIDLRDMLDMQISGKSDKNLKTQYCLHIETKQKKYTFQFLNQQQLENYHSGLLYMKQMVQQAKEEQMNADHTKQLALDLFAQADTDLSGFLSFDEGFELIKKINVKISKEQLFRTFTLNDGNNDKKISKEEFVNIAREFSQKYEFVQIFKQYCPEYNEEKGQNFAIMAIEQFLQFLYIEQGQEKSQLDSLTWYRLNSCFSTGKKIISPNEFSNFMYNYSNSIFDPAQSEQYQDMNQPLTDYYINSSHNTYLMSNQLTGESSLQAYINAFRLGCRCVEIDTWDRKGEVVVTHGFTLTSVLKFKDVIKIIKQYGFNWSKFPLILSIENHCGKDGQQYMADVMHEIFKEALYTLPENYRQVQYFPSPQALKNRVIVKSKGESSNHSSKKPKYKHLERMQTQQPSKDGVTSSPTSTQNQDGQQPINNENEAKNSDQPALKKSQTLGNEEKEEYIPVEVHFQKCISMIGTSLKNSTLDQEHINKATAFDIVSLSEGKIESLIKSNEELLIFFQKRNLTRGYPKGGRVDSSNYDPFPGFQTGTHLIALNFQTTDYNLFTYLSLFQQNGGINSGYVLKPSYLRHSHTPQTNDNNNINKHDDHSQCKLSDNFKNVLTSSRFQVPKYQLKVKIISAQCIKSDEVILKTINPYVEVTIKGTDADTTKKDVSTTDVVQNNAFHPIFNHTEATFSIFCPELAMIVFQVYSQGLIQNELIAQYALNFTCIRTGYRIVPLWSKSLKPIPHAMILVHCQIIKQNV